MPRTGTKHITAFTESQFLPRYGKIGLVGSAILPVETAIAVPTSIILVGTAIAVSTGRIGDPTGSQFLPRHIYIYTHTHIYIMKLDEYDHAI